MNEQEKRRLAELETAQARAGQSAAEFERDVVAGVAVNEAVNRAVAEDATSEAKMRANQAESRERSMATSASLSRQDASNERAAASNATFGAIMIAVVALAIVLVVGYFAWWQPGHRVDASQTTLIRTDKTTEKMASPSSVIVEQPDVNVKVVLPQSSPQPEPKEPSSEAPAASDAGQSPAPPADSDNKPVTDNP